MAFDANMSRFKDLCARLAASGAESSARLGDEFSVRLSFVTQPQMPPHPRRPPKT
jgi:hypothetical protein